MKMNYSIIIGDTLVLQTIKDISWSYVLPGICLFGVMTNIINVIAFSDFSKFKNVIYKYMLIHSIADALYLLFSFVYFFAKFTIEIEHIILARFIDVIVYFSLTTALAISIILIELAISFQRLLIVTNSSHKIKVDYKKVTLIILMVAFGMQAIYFVSINVKEIFDFSKNSSNEIVRIKLVTFAKVKYTWILNLISKVESIFRGIIAPLLLFTFNFAMLFFYKKQMRRKASMMSVSQSNFIYIYIYL